jgi:hypothetical protein
LAIIIHILDFTGFQEYKGSDDGFFVPDDTANGCRDADADSGHNAAAVRLGIAKIK